MASAPTRRSSWPPAKRRIRQLETELAVSRKVNEVFLDQHLPPKGSTRGSKL
jgi:hypothetical protein